MPRSPTSASGRAVMAATAPGASVRSKSGSIALPDSKTGRPSTAWKRKSPGTSVKRTPTSAAFFSDEAARRPASLVSKKRRSLALDGSTGAELPAAAEVDFPAADVLEEPPEAERAGEVELPEVDDGSPEAEKVFSAMPGKLGRLPGSINPKRLPGVHQAAARCSRCVYTAARMTPRDVAQALREISQLLQIKGENAFKVRAYDLGADAFDTLPSDPAAPGGLNERVKNGTLTELSGVGKAISDKVTELVTTGHLRFLDDLRREFPLGALDLMRVPGLGPRKAAVLIRELDVANLDDLERVAREGRVRGLKGFGERTEKLILDGIGQAKARQTRQPLYESRRIAEKLLDRVRKAPGVLRAEIAGSVRRYAETNGDIDLVVASAAPDPAMEAFSTSVEVMEVIARGPTKCSVRLRDGLQADLRVVPE